MFVKQNKSHKGILLTYTIGYRENGKVKHKNIETIGYLEDLKKIYDDPISHFKELAKKRSNDEINELTIKNLNSKIIEEDSNLKNLGYIILKKIYSEIGIKSYLVDKQKSLNIDYNLDEIFSLLINSRILYPSSKKNTYDNKDIFFDTSNFSLKDLYRSLDIFSKYKEELQSLIWKNTKDKYNRISDKTYYDCTNYYFEIDYNDEDLIDEEGNILEKGYRKRGPEKNHRPDPIIEMGLLMDASGIPMAYDLFPGNESEKTSLRPILKKTKAKFGIDRTIVVADRGLNTSDNIFFLAGKNDDNSKNTDGYVYGQSVRGADKEFKDWCINQDDYISDKVYDLDGNVETYRAAIFNEDRTINHYEKKEVIFKHKSRIYAKQITIKKDNKRNVKTTVYQKQMVYYSQKYADKQKRERNIMIERAKDLIKHPMKYTQVTSRGSAAYINNIKFDSKTGEVLEGLKLTLNENKIEEEEKYDGYYSIVTSELNMTDKELRNIYRGLAKIEDTFKVTKSTLESRPVYVWTKEHIESHFLTCFISLVIIRLLEIKLNRKYSPKAIIESIRKYTSTKIEHDIYIQNYTDNIIKDCDKIFNINLSKKYRTLSEIKKILNF